MYQTNGRVRMAAGEMSDRFKRAYSQTEAYYYLWGLRSSSVTAGMNHSETIFANNKDEKAPIFKTAHYCLVGDLYDVIPQLIQKIEEKKGA